MSGILLLKDMNTGSTLKQGDKTELKYQLVDGNGEPINHLNKSAIVRLVTPEYTAVAYEKATTVGTDNIVSFTIDNIIPARKYCVEILVDNKFLFPSVEDGRILNVDKSSLGQEANVIEVIGKDVIVRDVLALVENNIDDELERLNDSYNELINDGILQENIDQKLNEFVESQAPELANISAQLAQTLSEFDDVLANTTVDSEVIVARKGHTTLGNRLDRIDRNLSNPLSVDTRIFGVHWDKTSNPTLTRTDSAEGLVANIGIGSQLVRNDFDSLPIWGEIERVLDDYGNEFIKIPKFYIQKKRGTGYWSTKVSKARHGGFYLSPLFYDFENEKELDCALIASRNASLSDDGTKLESKAGKLPHVNVNIVTMRNLAKANGVGYQQMDIHAVDVLQILFMTEFATLHSQSIHPGYTGGTEAMVSGMSDDILASSGAMGTSNLYPFNYRGIENPWGNVYQFIDGININEFQAWVAEDARTYASNVFANPYKKLGYANALENGYPTEMGFDSNYPYAEFPKTLGGNASSYFADYYYQATGQRVALFGGAWSAGSVAGLSFWHLSFSSGTAAAYLGGRMVRKPL